MALLAVMGSEYVISDYVIASQKFMLWGYPTGLCTGSHYQAMTNRYTQQHQAKYRNTLQHRPLTDMVKFCIRAIIIASQHRSLFIVIAMDFGQENLFILKLVFLVKLCSCIQSTVYQCISIN